MLISSVNALVITPNNFDITVVRGVSRDVVVSVRNDNLFPVMNVSWSPIADFLFPVIPLLSPNESVDVSFRVSSQTLYSNSSSSVVSFLYLVPFSADVRNVSLNLSQDGFSPFDLTIFVNDSVLWQNLMSQDVVVGDFGSTGFSSVSIPALSMVSRRYDVVADFQFFDSVHGRTGRLHVIPRSVLAYAHDSSFDRVMSFSVHSVMSSSALQANLVSGLTVDNNQSVTGYLQVINNDKAVVMTGVHLSANRWVKSFSENDFNLAPSTTSQVSSKLISFVIQPFVSETDQTNRSQDVVINLSTTNSGSFSSAISIFINFQNMNLTLINGTLYSINRLSINDTVHFCVQHPSDVECLALQRSCIDSGVCHNETLVQQIEAQYNIGEGDLKTIIGQQKVFGDVSQRLENKMNSYVDKQDSINSKVDNLSNIVFAIKSDYDADKLQNKKQVDKLRQLYWISGVVIVLFIILLIIVYLVTNFKYYSALEQSLQLGGDLS